MKNFFSSLKLGGKLIIIGGIIAVISLFVSWYSYSGYLGSVYMNGFEHKSYWILVSFIYPFGIILNKENINKKYAIISLLVGFLIWFAATIVMAPLDGDFESGSYLMLLSLIISLFGVLIIKNNTKMIKEKSTNTTEVNI